MSDRSSIEWTDATWNPVTGCTKVSPGCDNCYAETFAERWRGTVGHHFENGFDVQLRPERLDQPLKWRKPRRIFVNSMSDLFHDQVPDEYIARVFAIMALTPQHTYQILTKRHGRMRSFLTNPPKNDHGEHEHGVGWLPGSGAKWMVAEALEEIGRDADRRLNEDQWALVEWPAGRLEWPLPNVWLGVSVEDQKWADIRIPALLDTLAAVRWISAEPLLGPLDLAEYLGPHCRASRAQADRPFLDWVVAGGESGPGARPMHPDWARSLRDQCVNAGVPYLFKQWGAWGPAPFIVRVCDPKAGWQGTEEELADAKRRSEAQGATHVHTGQWYMEDGQKVWNIHEIGHKPWSLERVGLPDGMEPMRRWGKKAAGRDLDGRTWDQYPEPALAGAR